MLVLLDEDVPVQLLEPLRHLTRKRHSIDHVTQVHLQGRKDAPLLRIAQGRGYGAIVTGDLAQLDDPKETVAIARSGLHHVRFAQKPGLRGLAYALGSLVASLPGILDELEGISDQRLVKITGLDPSKRRYEIIDPTTDPPAYWPRRRSRRG
jgi:hypothetical protein